MGFLIFFIGMWIGAAGMLAVIAIMQDTKARDEHAKQQFEGEARRAGASESVDTLV